jgi:hypothetical protein
LALFVPGALLAGFVAGYLVGRAGGPHDASLGRAGGGAVAAPELDEGAPGPRHPPGLWQQAAAAAPRDGSERIAELETIGYLSGYERASGQENVTVWVPELAYDGLNLHTSGHLPEAQLMDMDGRVVHRWRLDFRAAFPKHPAERIVFGMAYWRRVHPFENGDLLAIYEGYGLIKVDRDSNLLWANAGRYHHDLFVDRDGRIYTLVRRAELVPRIHEEEYVLLDYVTILEPDGALVRRIPLLEAFERSPYASFLANAPEHGDIFHTNTIEVFDGSQAHRSPIFAAGNILLSIREMNVIAILDPARETIVWALSGQWILQHQPTLLDSGRILLFDNLGHHGHSKVIELDPFTQEIVWAYEGTSENGFASPSGGSCQRLPNGNTLITESEAGRAFEVTGDGTVVWEFHNLARAGENDELVANLCEVIRLERGFPGPWLAAEHGG